MTTPTLPDAARMALDALETCDAQHPSDGGRQWYDEKAVDAAITALRAALSAAPAAVPVAWLCKLMQEDGSTREQIVTENPAGLRWNDMGEPSPYSVTPLYAAPVAQQAAEPDAMLAEYLRGMADERAAHAQQQAATVQPDGKLHADGYFTWHRRDGYVLDRRLPCDFYLAPPAAHAQQQAAAVQPMQALGALKDALDDMRAIGCDVPESASLIGYFCNRINRITATQQAPTDTGEQQQ